MCVLCHNPIENDGVFRPAADDPTESVDFELMIHRIHSGPSQTRTFTIWGYGGNPNNFNNVLYPGDLENCSQCHLPGTNNVPAGGVAMINDNRGFIDPVFPTTGACLGCHATVDAASHALANTNAEGESCAVCHGPNGAFAVGTVHSSGVRVDSSTRPKPRIMVTGPQRAQPQELAAPAQRPSGTRSSTDLPGAGRSARADGALD
jgi:OmcA/MtrC family decaheme c-type cytochrome